jgi:hypothetical protein
MSFNASNTLSLLVFRGTSPSSLFMHEIINEAKPAIIATPAIQPEI